MRKFIFLLVAAAFTLSAATAQELDTQLSQDSTSTELQGRFLPTRQRIDRKIGQNKFVYKGEYMLGLTASYGSLSADDADVMLLLDNLNVGLRSATVKPFFAYSYRDNLAVGFRFGYELINGTLGNADLNLGLLADMDNMGISNVGLRSENFTWSLFHRHYLGLDRRGIVGVIMETELMLKTGTTSSWSGAGDDFSRSDSRNFAARFNFNPGLGVYVFPQVCLTVTVGVGGLYYNNIRQIDASGIETGRRDRTGLSFKLNLADIQIGLVAHLWNKKK
jgi:opacity protein-like surface antigen